MTSNSKIRFQHRGFKDSLRAARNYKRTAKEPTQGAESLKQLNGKAVIVLLAIIVAGIYFLYVPNPLSIKQITISGLNQKQTDGVRVLLGEYFGGNSLLPRSNIALLSKAGLAEFLLERDQDILRITEIKKRLNGTLEITATPREARFLLTSPEGAYLVASDGLISAAGASTSTSSLIRLEIIAAGIVKDGAKFENAGHLAAVNLLAQKLPAASPEAGLERLELPNFKQTDITAHMSDGSRFLFDYTADLEDSINKLHLLLTSIAPGDAKRLAYVDMRIKNRSYVCLKGTPCAEPVQIVAGTTTPESVGTATSTEANR